MKIQILHKSKIKTSEKFLKIVHRHTEEERELMISTMQSGRIEKPLEISTFSDTLVDGMGRFEIGCSVGIEEFPIIFKDFKSENEELLYIMSNTIAQRQLETWEVGKLNNQRTKLLKQMGADHANSDAESAQNCANVDVGKTTSGKTSEKVSKGTGIGTRNQEKVNMILKYNDEDIIKKLDEKKITLNKAEKLVNKEKKFKEKKKQLKKVNVNLPDFVKLHNSSFQDCKLSQKVRMVFTDPPYLATDLPLIEELAKYVWDNLEEGGVFLCYMGHHIIPQVLDIFKKQGLTYQHIFTILNSGPSTKMWKNDIMIGYKPILFFSKGKYKIYGPIRDVVKSEKPEKEHHEWAQSTIESDYYIDQMTKPGETVCDPCMGSGTFGISTTLLKRKFVGIEINEEYFETASKRITLAAKNSK